ncbi:MAG: cell division protein FtsA, partial [Microgenomates group bacterium]
MNRTKILSSIDIGSSKVAVLIGQQSETSGKINILGASSLPSMGIRKSQIVNIEEASDCIIKAVEAAERMAGLAVGKVLVSVGGTHISSQNSHGVVAVANPEGEIVSDDVKRAI